MEKRKLTCREFDLVNSMIQTIWKNRIKIINVFEQNISRTNRFWKPEWSDATEVLLKWFKQQRSEIVPVSGPQMF
jgi:hypothetical protein